MTALLALMSSALWGSADFIGGTLSRRVHAFAVVGASQALALVLIVPLVFLVGATGDPTGYLPWGVAAGLLGSISLVAFYAALAVGTMGVVAPIAATGVVVPVAIGIGQGDRPSAFQLAGVALAIAGVVLASGPELRGARDGKPGGMQSLILAAGAAVGFGLVLWMLSKGAHYSVAMTLLTQRSASVAAALTALLVVRRIGGLTFRELPPLAVVGAGDAAANGLYSLASRGGLVSLVAVLGSLYPVATVLLARAVHGERMRVVQNVGVGAALCGVVLIAAGGV
jgi:drug/metabolite transporter (DMT)-like permease